MTKHLFHDDGFNQEAVQQGRNALLAKSIEFWTHAVQIQQASPEKQSWRAIDYRRLRAMCYARLGNHEMAFDEVKELSNESNLTGQTLLDFARICAVCAYPSRRMNG